VAWRILGAGSGGGRRRGPADRGSNALAGLATDAGTMTAEREGRHIPLTRLQGAILAAMLRDAPRIVPHARLIEAAT